MRETCLFLLHAVPLVSSLATFYGSSIETNSAIAYMLMV